MYELQYLLSTLYLSVFCKYIGFAQRVTCYHFHLARSGRRCDHCAAIGGRSRGRHGRVACRTREGRLRARDLSASFRARSARPSRSAAVDEFARSRDQRDGISSCDACECGRPARALDSSKGSCRRGRFGGGARASDEVMNDTIDHCQLTCKLSFAIRLKLFLLLNVTYSFSWN